MCGRISFICRFVMRNFWQKEYIEISKEESVLIASIIFFFLIQFIAMYWNITQNSRKYRSGLQVQGWSTNWILNWNDASKQCTDLDWPLIIKMFLNVSLQGCHTKSLTFVHLEERFYVRRFTGWRSPFTKETLFSLQKGKRDRRFSGINWCIDFKVSVKAWVLLTLTLTWEVSYNQID